MPFLGLIHDNADHLARDFYATLLQRAESHRYLGSAGCRIGCASNWRSGSRNAFSAEAFRDAAAFEARQQEIGAIHARIAHPVHLVDIGAARIGARRSPICPRRRRALARPLTTRCSCSRGGSPWRSRR
jgi:diguanylate cyclase